MEDTYVLLQDNVSFTFITYILFVSMILLLLLLHLITFLIEIACWNTVTRGASQNTTT